MNNFLDYVNEKMFIEINFEALIWDENFDKAFIKIFPDVKVKIEKHEDLSGERSGSKITLAFKKELERKDILDILGLLSSQIYNKDVFDVDLFAKIQKDNFFINIILYDTRLEIRSNFPNISEASNKTLLCKNNDIPSYCNWILQIDSIRDGKHYGKLIRESGSFHKKEVKEYEF